MLGFGKFSSLKNPVAVLLALVSAPAFNQNLVPNPGFEEFTKCPVDFTKTGQVFSLPGWYSPSLGTPDYFNDCTDGESNGSVNWAGIARDHFGHGYVGIISFMTSRPYREYLVCDLTQSLDSGITYLISFKFRLSSYSKISSGRLGVALSPTRISVMGDTKINLDPVAVAMRDSAMVPQTGNWQNLHTEYFAKGSEKHLLIGNFSSSESIPFYKIRFGGNNEPMLYTASYFYIDDVVVKPKKSPIDVTITEGPKNPFEKDSLVTLRNVQFPYNSALMLPGMEDELDKFVEYLRSMSKVRVEIHGHTDDQGTDEYNQKLSLARATSVMKYLIQKGVAPSQMRALGFGKSMPLIKSKDEKARSVNRRVEIKLVH
jgi:OmpA-OmpF porin, OOP family